MTQYHYLDESGDPGMAGLESSSRYFAIALVQVVDNASLTELSAVRQKFHFPNTFEFKYHGTRLAIKESFFASLRKKSSTFSFFVEKSSCGISGEKNFPLSIFLKLKYFCYFA